MAEASEGSEGFPTAGRNTVSAVPRLATLLAAIFLALPGAAFAQGAGDDQYQDPFGDEPDQQQSDDGGLTDSPPTTGGSGDDAGSGSSGGSGGGSAEPSSGSAGAEATAAEPTGPQLPRTGSDPWQLLLVGLSLLLIGVGLRLRTIDPDAY